MALRTLALPRALGCSASAARAADTLDNDAIARGAAPVHGSGPIGVTRAQKAPPALPRPGRHDTAEAPRPRTGHRPHPLTAPIAIDPAPRLR